MISSPCATTMLTTYRPPIASQLVRANPAFQWRQPCHQRDQDDHAVPGEQAEDLPGPGQPGAEPVRAGGVLPPQCEDDHRPEADSAEHNPRTCLSRNIPWCVPRPLRAG